MYPMFFHVPHNTAAFFQNHPALQNCLAIQSLSPHALQQPRRTEVTVKIVILTNIRLELQLVAPVEIWWSNHHPSRPSLINCDGWQAEAEVIGISSSIIMGGCRVCVIKPKPMSLFMADHMDGRGVISVPLCVSVCLCECEYGLDACVFV